MSKITDIPTRFFSNVNKDGTGGCWLWMGSTQKNGYGRFCSDHKVHMAHRWSYEYHKGAIPKGMEIDHLCRVRNCVNPNHLEAVTPEINKLRARKTHCSQGHPYDETNTLTDRVGWRTCKTCTNARSETLKTIRRAPKRPFLRNSA